MGCCFERASSPTVVPGRIDVNILSAKYDVSSTSKHQDVRGGEEEG